MLYNLYYLCQAWQVLECSYEITAETDIVRDIFWKGNARVCVGRQHDNEIAILYRISQIHKNDCIVYLFVMQFWSILFAKGRQSWYTLKNIHNYIIL